jgi:hypothetical protein
MFSRIITCRCRDQAVPFSDYPRRVATGGTGLPLSSHFNPWHASCHESSLGDFLTGARPPPSLFCREGLRFLIPPPAPLKAGYTAHSSSPHTGSSQAVVVHHLRQYTTDSGSPRRQGHRPHAVVDRPVLLNSQHQLPTGRRQPAPGTSSLCPQRIFRPVFREAAPTRILHHLCLQFTRYYSTPITNPQRVGKS